MKITMKKLIVLFMMIVGVMPSLRASGKCDQRLTQEEFRERQKAYITENAGLTQAEAAKFFPLFFELQDRKKKLNDEAWKLIRRGKNEHTTETGYEEIMEGIYGARVASDLLDQTYFKKYKEILSCKKIYLIRRAEMKFHRDLVKNIHSKCKSEQAEKQAVKK